MAFCFTLQNIESLFYVVKTKDIEKNRKRQEKRVGEIMGGWRTRDFMGLPKKFRIHNEYKSESKTTEEKLNFNFKIVNVNDLKLQYSNYYHYFYNNENNLIFLSN